MSLSSGPLSPRSKTRVPGSLCNQKVNLRTNSETLYCSLLKEKILLLLSSITKTKRNMRRTATRTATEITQTEYSTKNIFRSISLSLRLWGFLCVRDAGHRANKISVKVPLHKFNSKNNRPVFFILDSIQTLNCFVSSERKDGHGLKFLEVSMICLQKSWLVLPDEICLISFFYRSVLCMGHL